MLCMSQSLIELRERGYRALRFLPPEQAAAQRSPLATKGVQQSATRHNPGSPFSVVRLARLWAK
jgi:hypothetical protein